MAHPELVAALRERAFERVLADAPALQERPGLPDDPIDQHHVALACYELGDWERALDLCGQVQVKAPELGQSRMLQALMALESGRPLEALELLETLASSLRGAAWTLSLESVALGRLGRWDEAGAALERLLELEPARASAHFNLGVVRVHQQRWQDAALAFTTFAEVDGRPLDAVRQLFVEIGRAAALEEVAAFSHQLLDQLTEGGDQLRALLAQLESAADQARVGLRLSALQRLHQQLYTDTSAFIAAIAPRRLTLELIDPQRLIETCLSVASRSLEAIKVTCALGPGVQEVVGDERMLRKALLNLILRGADAASGAGLTESGQAELRISTAETSGEVVIVIEDSGPSIDEPLQHELFDLRCAAAELGLYQARQIVTRHGGRIHLECHRDRGARFVITLPCSPGATVDLESLELRSPLYERLEPLIVDS